MKEYTKKELMIRFNEETLMFECCVKGICTYKYEDNEVNFHLQIDSTKIGFTHLCTEEPLGDLLDLLSEDIKLIQVWGNNETIF